MLRAWCLNGGISTRRSRQGKDGRTIRKTLRFRRRMPAGPNSLPREKSTFLLKYTQDEITANGWDKVGAESPYPWGIDTLMDESQKCKMLFELMKRLVTTENTKGESERAAVLSMSPATAMTIYHVS
jgi:hypothetical protein